MTIFKLSAVKKISVLQAICQALQRFSNEQMHGVETINNTKADTTLRAYVRLICMSDIVSFGKLYKNRDVK